MATLVEKERSEKWRGFPLRDLNAANRALLQALQNVAGIAQILICDNRGEMLGALINGAFDQKRAHQIGAQIAQMYAALEARGKKSRDLELRLARGNLLARDLGHAFVVVIGAPNVDWALLRMSLNVAAAPYEKNAALQNILREATPARADLVGTSPASGDPAPLAAADESPVESPASATPEETDDDARHLWAKFP